MHGTAHISFAGGGMILPAHSSYDRQLVFEHFVASGRRHERVALSARGRRWTVSPTRTSGERCAECARALRDLAYRRGEQSLCARCVRRALVGERDAMPTPRWQPIPGARRGDGTTATPPGAGMDA